MTREVETGSTVDGVPNPNPNLNPTSEVCSAVVPKPKAKKPQAAGCRLFGVPNSRSGQGWLVVVVVVGQGQLQILRPGVSIYH